MDWIMRKYILIVAVAVASFFAYSCNSGTIDREEVPVPTVKLVPLVLNSGHSVKTSLDPNGSSVNWTSGDHIAVIDNVEYSAVRDFEAESVEGSSATFVGSVAEGTEQFYAVYPLDCVTGANESSISVTLPSAQNPASGTFAEELNISVASGSKSPGIEDVNNVVFNNLCGLLKFTMPAELGEINEVKFIANRPIAGELSISKETMSLLSAGNVNTVSMTGTFAPNSTFYFVITPGEISSFSVSVTTSNGVILTKSSEKQIQISAGKIKNLGKIPMVVVNENLSVAHTTSEGILTGTEVKFTPSIEENTEFTAELLNTTGTVVRTLNSTATGSELILPAVDGQPYIPQGPYVFRYSYTINGVRYTKAQTVAVPKPKFEGKTTVSATTSYSLAKSGNTSAANSYDASKIGTITSECEAVAMISPEVLAQIPVSYDIALDGTSIKTGKTNVQTVSVGDKTGQSVGEHSLKATYTFDGVMLECSASCVITGLPLFANPPTQNGGWTDTNTANNPSNKISWGNNEVKLESYSEYAKVVSPQLYLPSDLQINVYCSASLYSIQKLGVLHNSKLVCTINGFELYSLAGIVRKEDLDWKKSGSTTIDGSFSKSYLCGQDSYCKVEIGNNVNNIFVGCISNVQVRTINLTY